jgi:hypothetical protein
MAGMTVPGSTVPAVTPGYGGAYSPAGGRVPGVEPNLSQVSKYRADAGRNMTDEQYNQWKASVSQSYTSGSLAYNPIGGNQSGAALSGLSSAGSGGEGSAPWGSTGGVFPALSTPAAKQAEATQELAGQQALQGAQFGQQTKMQTADIEAAKAAELARQAFAQSQYQQRLTDLPKIISNFQIPLPDAPTITANEPDVTAADQAAFGRAKDRIGQTARGSLESLQDVMSERGLARSGIEAGEMGKILQGGVGQLSDTAREQALEQLRRAQSVSDRNLAAQLTTRGQNIAGMGQQQATAASIINGLLGALY